MTQYTKDGVLHTLGTSMPNPNREGYTINPNAEWLLENGWTLVIPEVTPDPEPEVEPEATPAELRKEAYAIELIVQWESEMITVDAANSLFVAYLAEGNTDIATSLSSLIAEAKETIRTKYPD